MGEPDSLDHQLSMTCAPGAAYFSNRSWYVDTIEGSERSPAKNRALSDRRPFLLPTSQKNLFSGSSLLMARRAVGAVNSMFTLYSSTMRQSADASGVPTGFPS